MHLDWNSVHAGMTASIAAVCEGIVRGQAFGERSQAIVESGKWVEHAEILIGVFKTR